MWDYVDEIDARFTPAVDYLSDKIEGKVLIDLNCGEARLLQYLPHSFKRYYGNDLRAVFPSYPKCQFDCIPDTQVNPKQLDVLMCWGMGGYELTKEPVESPTISHTILRLGDRHPSVIILEAVWAFDVLTESLIRRLPDYAQITESRFDCGNRWTHKRRVVILERVTR